MGSLGGGGRSGAALLLRPHRLGFKLAKNDDLALVPPDLPSFPADTDFNTVTIKNTMNAEFLLLCMTVNKLTLPQQTIDRLSLSLGVNGH